MISFYFLGLPIYKRALKEGSSVLPYLEELEKWIQSWKVVNHKGQDITSRFKFIKGWVSNIRAFKILLHKLTSEHGFEFLLTRRVCTDPLENLFATIRGKGGFNQNPTCQDFATAIKQIVAN